SPEFAGSSFLLHDFRRRRTFLSLAYVFCSLGGHRRPTFELLSFPYRPPGRAIDHISLDLHSPPEINDNKISIRSHTDRSFFWIDAENPGGVFATNLHQLLQGDTALVNAFGQHDRQVRLYARRETAAGFPYVPFIHLFARHSPIHVIGAKAIQSAGSQSFPKVSHGCFITKRNVKLPYIVSESKIVMPGLRINRNPFRPGL